MNLLQETLDELKSCGKTTADVIWVGSTSGYAITWDEFAKIADFEYDDGYGSAEIAIDLLVVGKDWWLERREYDGSEGWSFKTGPVRKADSKPFNTCKARIGWDSLSEIMEEKWDSGEEN